MWTFGFSKASSLENKQHENGLISKNIFISTLFLLFLFENQLKRKKYLKTLNKFNFLHFVSFHYGRTKTSK
jgi:hypothetical protein